ncbi:hypothetical protein QQF64_012220 [Cirrhinus molitorella]|uniref:Uncharacterized protein n=1 Tax=Cirrhinus molitorella TaxID=172907 RepID=A0ABR3LWH2_9TELE
MPDREAQRWIREKAIALFLYLLSAYPSVSSNSFSQPPHSLSCSSHPSPPLLQCLCNSCPIFMGEVVREERLKEQVGGNDGDRRKGGPGVLSVHTAHVRWKTNCPFLTPPTPPCATLLLRHHLHPLAAHPRSSLDEPCFMKHSRDWRLLRLR